jgi:hypothetical protein
MATEVEQKPRLPTPDERNEDEQSITSYRHGIPSSTVSEPKKSKLQHALETSCSRTGGSIRTKRQRNET